MRTTTSTALGLALGLTLGLALGIGCGGLPRPTEHGLSPEPSQTRGTTMQLASSAFGHGREIPGRHTCEGKDVSPDLSWSGVPPEARSLALIVDDPDAPDPAAPQRTWVHWVLYELPPGSEGLSEGVPAEELPSGTRQGLNDWDRTGYGGPCPPIGRHRYFFKLYALDTALPELDRPTKADLERAMEGHVLAEATLMGTYRKTGGR